MARNCCACQNTPQPDSCRVSITGADLVEQLLYYQGLDENLCTKFMEYVPFIDCAGNPITPGAAIVTCPEFEEQLCEIISTLASGGEVVLGVTEVVGADCQVYVIPETPLVATDSTSIDFTTSGPFGHNITGVVRISAAPDNSIVILPDGLYVPTACEQLSGALAGAPAVLGVTGLLGTDCLTHVVPETPITVVDTITVDLTSSGAFGHTIEADVNVSAVVGNQLVIQPDGLYVPPAVVTDVCEELQDFPVGAPGVPGVTQFVGADCELHVLPAGSDTIIAVTDGDCIDLSVVEGPADTWTISADLEISPNAGNSLSCVGNGLFSPEITITADDTDCINLTVTEPTDGDFIISADPIISPVVGNVIQCTPQGLFVPAAAVGDPVVLTSLDSDCIDVEVIINGANDFTVTADLILGDAYPGFPAGSNPALCGLDGLVVPPPSTGAISAARFTGPAPFVAAIGGPTTIGALGITVNNPSAFRSAIVIVSMSHPALSVVATAAGQDSIILESQIEFLLPGFVTPFTRFAISAVNGMAPNVAGSAFAMDGNGSTFHLTQAESLIPPGGAATINARLLWTNNGASTPLISIGDYGISLTLITI